VLSLKLLSVGSVTRRLTEKCAQFCPNIAQNGALVNKNFSQRNIWSKLGNFKTKSTPNLELIKVNFGRYFPEKNAPNAKKYRPNGEILPNLVTLSVGKKTFRHTASKFTCTSCPGGVVTADELWVKTPAGV
jgi:hypothetical protein